MQIKPKILTRFLMRRFVGSFMLVLLVVCGIIFTITFVEKLPSESSASAALYTSFALLLEYMPLLLPFVVFIGTLLAMYNLTRSSEGVIISGAGWSPYQSMRPFLAVAAIIGIIATVAINPVATMLSDQNIGQEHMELVDDAIFLRESYDNHVFTMRSSGVRTAGDALLFTNASAFVLSNKGQFQNRIEAPEIMLVGGKFTAYAATIFNIAGTQKHVESWQIGTSMTPGSVLERHLKPNQVSFWNLPKFIKSLKKMGLNPRGHFIQFWTLLFLPLTLISMTVLSIAFAQTKERRNFSFGYKFSIGILACFILYFIINVFSALGASGSLPTILATLAPPLIVLSAAAIAIVSFDNV